MKWRRIMVQSKKNMVKAYCDVLKIETMYMEGSPAKLSDRNAIKMEALAQAGSEFIIALPVN